MTTPFKGYILSALFLGVVIFSTKKVLDMAWNTVTPWDSDFNLATDYYNLPPNLLKRQAWTESRFKPDAVSPAGARGLMQFMPATWAEWGRGYPISDPKAQISAAGAYMAYLYRQTGSWALALAAYNWGIGNVTRKVIAPGVPLNSVAPLETRNYVTYILSVLPGVA
jgi:soluble lytic murein transglycosylase-like protein